MDKVPFCDNPLCCFHAVQVSPMTDRIKRDIAVGEGEELAEEVHTRSLYHVKGDNWKTFCEVCASAIELCRQEQEKPIIPERKLVLLS